ncbi:MAG: response regulator [Bryobacterales bacterium]|nr:response regulator [Bryobacterales bacterium]
MSSPSRSQTVLVVDDDHQLLDLARAILQDAGFRVITAEDGAQALKIAVEYQDPIRLLLTDIVLPEMSGRKLAQCIGPLHPEMKILFMSGYGDNIVHREEYGDSLLSKPFDQAQLLEKIRSVVPASSHSVM